MIAKISSGKNIYGLIAYHLRKLDHQKASVLMTHNCYTAENRNVSDLVRSFKPFLNQKTRTKQSVFHASLNPSPDDKISDGQFILMVEEYMKEMGYADQPYIVIKHSDIDREHVHIISVRIDKNGKNMNNDFEYRRSNRICRELEQKYGLNQAQKKEWKEDLPLKKVDYRSADLKKQIGSVLKGLCSYRCSSWNEYRTLLSLYNIKVEEQTGLMKNGDPYFGIVYSALDDTGKTVGKPLKSSLFGKFAGHEALQNRFKRSAQTIREKGLKDYTRNTVAAVMRQFTERKSFEQELKKKGIDVIFRENGQNRIYGVTFVDHNQKMICNGSLLGKEFSANAFHELFNALPSPLPVTEFPFPPEKIQMSDLSGYEFSGLNFESLLPSDDYSPLPDDSLIREQGRTQRKKKKKRRGLRL